MGRTTARLLAAVLGVIAGASAFAHEPGGIAAYGGSWRATLVSATEPAPGVRITLLPGRVPGLFLESSTAAPVLVLGRSGEPFLRFTARGVEANVRSPLWRENALARGQSAPPPADPRAPAAWQQVTSARRLGWIEFRAWPGVDEPPAYAVAGRMTPPRWAWSIPARVGDRSISFVGLTTWQPAKQ